MTDREKKQDIKPIDIRQVFRDKNARLARFLPGFAFTLIGRLVHVKFINSILEIHGNKRGLEFAEALVKEFNITMEVRGMENLPDSGRFIFVSNHPLGGFDGMILLTILQKKYHNLKVFVNDILMNIKMMDGIFVPINKHGKQSYDAVQKIEEIYSSNDQVLTFPAGLVSRRKNGVIRDPEWKKNFITKAMKL